ncbi:MAG: FAD-dependent oxidoreductase [Phycisphaeraceae bacterium]|nr:FAD-dependent oxidoreductase [Phycisphaeraceae bacterium]
MTLPDIKTHCDTLIIGGGLAGIASALQLAKAGQSVTLVETRTRLGGRATSFEDRATHELLDNCQHVLLRCCTNLIDLYDRLGMSDQIDWHKRYYFCNAQGQIDKMEADDLPAPTHLTHSMMNFTGLTWSEKFAISRGMLNVMKLGVEGRKKWHHKSFAHWLKENRQPAGAIQKFWACVTISALNEQPQNMAADYALQVFQEAFCANDTAYYMGLPKVPLARLYDAAQHAIEKAGGQVLLRTSAEKLCYDQGKITSLQLNDGTQLTAKNYLCSVPFDRLKKLSDPAMCKADPRLTQLGEFHVSPIVGIHIWFSRIVMDLPHMALTQSPLRWIFNKGTDSAGWQHLHGVISAADDLISLSADEIQKMVVAEMRKVLPKVGNLDPVRHQVIKEKRATFRLAPGVDDIRPQAKGKINNLYLAGDWTDSGWPATMEGAVRSGYRAAGAILNQGDDLLISNLPESLLYQFISG